MNREEQAARNLELARAFFGRLLDDWSHPKPANGSTLVLVDRDDPELAAANRQMAEDLAAESGQPVTLLDVDDQGRVISERTLVIAPDCSVGATTGGSDGVAVRGGAHPGADNDRAAGEPGEHSSG